MPSLFIHRNPNKDREEALQQAREFLADADPTSPNEDENFSLYLQAAGLFIMYGSDDSELGLAGAEEMYTLAQRLRNLTLDTLLYETILNGTVLPNVDEDGELLISVANPEKFLDT